VTVTDSFDPRTGRRVATIPDSTPCEVSSVLSRSVSAAVALTQSSPAERRVWLEALADSLTAERAELAELADSETALGLPRLQGEVDRTAAQIRFYASVAVEGSYLGLTVDDKTTTSPRLVRINQPIGPVAVFGASNFPFAFGVLGTDTASALAAGCPVVAKSHPAHPRLSKRLASLAASALQHAGAPPGIFGEVSGIERGIDIVRAPEIRAVAFTGSQRGGLALWRTANERQVVIPVYAEMGTVNPVVVTPAGSIDMDAIAVGFVRSFTAGAGQFCTKPGILFAPAGSGAADAVARALKCESPQPVMLTQPIADGVDIGVARLVESGATIAERSVGSMSGWSADALVLAAPLEAITPNSPLLDECFGAVSAVVEYDTIESLVGCLRKMQGCLVGSVFGPEDDVDAIRVVPVLAALAGRVTRNDWPTGVAWTWSQHHGGPWPATTVPAATSVGAAALGRFVRPHTYQSFPDEWLPAAARRDNPWRLPFRHNGVLRSAPQRS